MGGAIASEESGKVGEAIASEERFAMHLTSNDSETNILQHSKSILQNGIANLLVAKNAPLA